MLSLLYKTYNLEKKHVFRIAGGARTSTPAILIQLTFANYIGYGEASMPPLYGESFQTAISFLNKIDLSPFKDPFNAEDILTYIDNVVPKNVAIKAAIDIALHDLIGQLLKIPLHSYFGLRKENLSTSKTIGIDTPDIIKERVKEASQFKYLKVKLGGENDKEIIHTISQTTDKPLFIDANQGWKSKEEALDKVHWLKEHGAVFIEQPLPKNSYDSLTWLAAHSPLPIIGDEGIQRLPDVINASNFYHGINIKLMKSTGLREAYKMAQTAKMMNLKIMLGCMSETSCAIGAAAQLGALADWVDLDGNLGIKNDPFTAHTVKEGVIHLNNKPGIGLINPNWDRILAY
ncbi:dipeptide epimerase [Joostella atrarenae]|uniref:Dipeptide epimerase n=1 Tax=Joostella atrarenae TaxID=679257 RepID=A0ABS9J4Q6_9FLAO|nr:dipeptide epimerase [Joostella atrarenae]MCF8715379.1 dipeptide epimerase [Joostella atrarenae]